MSKNEGGKENPQPKGKIKIHDSGEEQTNRMK